MRGEAEAELRREGRAGLVRATLTRTPFGWPAPREDRAEVEVPRGDRARRGGARWVVAWRGVSWLGEAGRGRVHVAVRHITSTSLPLPCPWHGTHTTALTYPKRQTTPHHATPHHTSAAAPSPRCPAAPLRVCTATACLDAWCALYAPRRPTETAPLGKSQFFVAAGREGARVCQAMPSIHIGKPPVGWQGEGRRGEERRRRRRCRENCAASSGKAVQSRRAERRATKSGRTEGEWTVRFWIHA